MSTTPSNPNVDVQKYGQSFWYDNIQRSIITSGELQQLITDYGVLGVTSNPAIFEKAIASSADYDPDIFDQVARGADARTIFEALAVADIQAAADLLEPVYEQTNGLDGYVSLEVSPDLARDCDGTVAEARRLSKAVGRRNLMIKVPATPECIPAIRQLISDGIHINVTLIFSLDGYDAVARAFIAGLKERASLGLPVNIASVASFFVSRVDTLVDKLLDEKIAQAPDADTRAGLAGLKSKAAIANARLAYQIFKRIFDEPEWRELAALGARPQRVLWASTSTKNPALPDTIYLDNLIGPHTVNTVPPATLKAFRDHGVVAPTIEADLDGAQNVMDGLAQAAISMPDVWRKLQDDGVGLFATAFKSLLNSIEAKRIAVIARGRAANVDVGLGYVDELARMKTASRVWNRDTSVWTSAPEHIKSISNRLGWLSVVEYMLRQVDNLVSFREEVKSIGMTDAVVLGMGGSSLAPDVFRATFQPNPPEPGGGGLRLHVLDTTDPATVLDLEQRINLATTLFIVASKSGGTVEISSFYKYFRSKIDELTGDNAGRHFIAITDDGTPLQSLAVAEGFHYVFVNPADIGGRYSALSFFGLVPAVLAGVPAGVLLRRAAQMAAWCKPDSAVNAGLWLGALLGGMALDGRDKVTFLLSPAIASFGGWVEQLIAESTGKNGRGIVPVEGETLSARAVSQLSPDRLYVHIKVGDDTTHDRLVSALRRAALPVIEIALADVHDLGAEFFRWEFATAVAGAVIGVNPFDEPNVTESKNNTRRLLEEYEINGSFSTEQSSKSANAQLNKFLRGSREGDYISIQGYLPCSPRVAAELSRIRALIGAKTGRPVTVGYGPRFLHSTGQLHKGGANNVVAVQLTCDPETDVPIPGEPYTFGTLIRAQALGDHESLVAHQRRVIRLHLGSDVMGGLRKIEQALKGTNRPAARASGARRATSARKTGRSGAAH